MSWDEFGPADWKDFERYCEADIMNWDEFGPGWTGNGKPLRRFHPGETNQRSIACPECGNHDLQFAQICGGVLRKCPKCSHEWTEPRPITHCEVPDCYEWESCRWVPAMTAYHTEIEDRTHTDNPNRDRCFCPDHAAEYEEYWTAMWDEYNASRG